MRVLGLSLATVVCLSGSASAASGTWLSDSHDVVDSNTTYRSAVAMAPNGNIALVYTVAGSYYTYLVRKPVGDGWTEPVLIDTPSATVTAEDLAIAVNSSGQVLVGFSRDNGSTGTVRTVIYSPSNTDADSNGLIKSSSFEIDGNSSHPQVALAEDGNALIAWQDGSSQVEDSTNDSHILASYLESPLPNAVEWSTAKSISYSGVEQDGIEGDASEVALDINGDGGLAIAWSRFETDGTGWDGSYPVLVDRVIQAVTFDSIEDLAEIDDSSDVDAETVSKTTSGSDGMLYYTYTPDVELSDNGDAFVTWYSGYGTRDDIEEEVYSGSFGFGLGDYGSIDHVIYAARAASGASFSASELLSDDDTIPDGRPSVGVDVNGNATFAWTQYDTSDRRDTVRTASYSHEGYKDPEDTSGSTQFWFDCADNADDSDGGTCGDPSDEDGDDTVDSNENVEASSARVATTPDGRPYVIWLDDSNTNYAVKTNYPAFTIDAAADSSSDPLTYMWWGGGIEQLETLDGTGEVDDHASLGIALDASGNGIASWVDDDPGTPQINGLDGAGPVFEEVAFGEGESSLSGEVGKELEFSARVYDIWAEDVEFSWDFGDGTSDRSTSSRASSDSAGSISGTTTTSSCAYPSDYTWCADTTHAYGTADSYEASVTATDDLDHSSSESGRVKVTDGTTVTDVCGGATVSGDIECTPTDTTTTNTTTTETTPTTTTDTTTTTNTTPGTEAAKHAVLRIKAKRGQKLRKAARAYFKKQVAKKSRKTRKKLLRKLFRKYPGILTYTASCSQASCKATFRAQLKIKRSGRKTVTIKLGRVSKTLKQAGKSYTVVVKLTRKQYSKLRKTLKRYGRKAKVTAPVSASGKTTANGLALISSSGKTSVKYTAKGIKR